MNEEDQPMRPGETLDGIASLFAIALFIAIPIVALALLILFW